MIKLRNSRVQKFKIKEEQLDQRLDNFLIKHLKGIPRSHLYRLIRRGEVRVNKRRKKPMYHLQLGDIVRIPPVRIAKRSPFMRPSDQLLNFLADRILYEDPNLLILNKPAGLASHGGSEVPMGLIETLRVLRSNVSFLELVHRLDKDTSGCLVVAKNRRTLTALHHLLKAREIEKTYDALTLGHWPKSHVRVELPITKNILRSGERMGAVSDQGKMAITEFHVKQRFEMADLVEVTLHTGRTHQIRLHATYHGHPVAGDTKYGDKEFNKIMKQNGLRRLFLHAKKIAFVLPDLEQKISVTAPWDDDLKMVLSQWTEGYDEVSIDSL